MRLYCVFLYIILINLLYIYILVDRYKDVVDIAHLLYILHLLTETFEKLQLTCILVLL